MQILITGGTGLIGRSLCQRLLEGGHSLYILSRRPEVVPKLCGETVRGVDRLEALDDVPLDAVINLAGAPIADRPWTRKRKALLWESRITLTEGLVEWLGKRKARPEVLISGSAVGWYGDTGEEMITEASGPRPSFTHTLCDAWEAAARRAASHGIRVCLVRTGLVLAPGGGFLQRMLLPFKLGLGGPIGSGKQYMPWVHLDDEVGIILHLLEQPDCKGAYNSTAPMPVSNREFASTLGKVLHRPAVLPVPAPLLKAGLGEMASLLLMGQNALPARLIEENYRFRYEQLEPALSDVLSRN